MWVEKCQENVASPNRQEGKPCDKDEPCDRQADIAEQPEGGKRGRHPSHRFHPWYWPIGILADVKKAL